MSGRVLIAASALILSSFTPVVFAADKTWPAAGCMACHRTQTPPDTKTGRNDQHPGKSVTART